MTDVASASAAGSASAASCPFSGQAQAHVPKECPVSARAAAFDPFEDAYQQDPPDYVRWAREQEPVFFSPKLGYWIVTRYEDIKAVFRDNISFSPSIALEKITPTSDEANAILASYNYGMSRTLVNEDEPAHMPRRRLLMDPFTPQALKHHEPMVRRLARQYVDRFVNDGKADLVDDMLWEATLTIALHFLGVPEEDMDALRRYSIAHTVNTWGRPKPEEQAEVAHAVGNFWTYAGEVLKKMRQDPSGPGWMKFGIRMQADHPEVITDSYLHSMMMAGIVAAHETTANATANAMLVLLKHPSAWREICEDPSLIPNAVEECLRHNGSVAAWRRLATRDVRVGGIDIAAGSKLLIVMSSANHDERHFPDGDTLDIRRDNASDHLTFGYGSHQCMGKNLARMEMQIFLEELSRRLPHMRLSAQHLTYVPNTSFRGPEHLLVEWDVTRNPERTHPDLLEAHVPVRIGEPSKHAITRPVLVKQVDCVANGVIRLRLVSPDGRPMPRWAPGAHIDVECGSADVTRQYSLCGDPADANVLEIGVLHEVNGRGGSSWIHQNVTAGSQLKIRGPRNHFRMDESATRCVFIAGGIGVTPISAMARRAKDLGIDYEFHYSGRQLAAMAFVSELTQLHGDRLHLYVSERGERNDLQKLLAHPTAGTKIYACGPVRMLNALEKACAHWPGDALRIEHFVSTVEALDPSKEHAFEVELKDSGLTLSVPADQTLLQVLRSANIDIQSDCEEGLCGSCEARVLSGQIDHRDAVLTRAERETHSRIMTCCSRADATKATKLVLEL